MRDLVWPRLTPFDFGTTTETTSKKSSPETDKPKKNKLKGVANIEINGEYFDAILHNNNRKVELAMQIISNDKTVKNYSTRFKRILLSNFNNTS